MHEAVKSPGKRPYRRRKQAEMGEDDTPRARYVDAVLADPDAVRLAREARAAEFWAGVAAGLEEKASGLEAELPATPQASCTGLRAQLSEVRRAAAAAQQLAAMVKVLAV